MGAWEVEGAVGQESRDGHTGLGRVSAHLQLVSKLLVLREQLCLA